MKVPAVTLFSALLFSTISPLAHSLELGAGQAVSSSHHMVEIFVSEEREKYGDVNAECTLLDRHNQQIDTVKTTFIQDRMPLYFKGRYWHVSNVNCRLKRS